jgi:ABC-type Fe3+-hydroxamate transport system substrate-binding protein
MSAGNGHDSHLIFKQTPERVVSLVPSLTQSLVDLDCSEKIVGVTEYCPPGEAGPLGVIVGGTHQVDIQKIISLEPDWILANQEENDFEDVEALEKAGLKVWVTFPKTVDTAIQMLWAIGRLFGVMKSATPKIRIIERSLEWARRSAVDSDTKSVFVPIWQEHHPDQGVYWMTFNSETYCDSILSACGGLNVFRTRSRRHPLEAEFDPDLAEPAEKRDTRYPRVALEEIIEVEPELILLPSEPFQFSDQHREEMTELLDGTPAVRNNKLMFVDGRWLSWHGTTMAEALTELPSLLE